MKPLILLALAALSTAQAAEQTGTLTLACEGTVTAVGSDGELGPISMGIVVNFNTGTVAGFAFPGADDFPVMIRAANEVTIAFSGSNTSRTARITGGMDRVTGELAAVSALGKSISKYSLKCKPT